MGITRLGQLAAADVSRKELQKQSKQAEDQHSLLAQLLWETKQTNKMLWAALSDEQRAAVLAMP